MVESADAVWTTEFKNRVNVIWKIKDFSMRLDLEPPNIEIPFNGTCKLTLETKRFYDYSTSNWYLRNRWIISKCDTIRDVVMVCRISFLNVHGVKFYPRHFNFKGTCKELVQQITDSEWIEKKNVLLPNDCLSVCVELMEVAPSQEESRKETVLFSRTEDLSRDLGHLFASKANSDVVLQVQEDRIPAHSPILSARSEVFAAMLKHDTVESRSRTVQIPDVEATVMNHLLLYMYTGKLEHMKDLPQDTLGQLYAAADKYAVLGLKEMCSTFMGSGLTINNFPDYANLAFNHSDAQLQNAVVNFISRDAAVLKSQQWLKMVNKNPTVASQVLGEVLKSSVK